MISTQLNITFISYFVKKINCISVFHRFFSKSVYVVDSRVYVCVLHFELRSIAAVPSAGVTRTFLRGLPTWSWNAPGPGPQTHARHLISYLKHLVLFFYFFWFVNKFILSHLAYDLFVF